MRQTFEIPGRLPGLNEYTAACRHNARHGNKVKQEATEACERAIRASGVAPFRGKVDVHITWVEKDMRRDKDNVRFAAKFVLDALVSQGVIHDDGWKWVGRISDDYMVNKSEPRVVVTVETAAARKEEEC